MVCNLDFNEMRLSFAEFRQMCAARSQEVAEVEGVVEEMKEEQTRMFRFPSTFSGKKTDLWLFVFMDDVDSPDLEIYSSPGRIKN